MAEVVRKEPLFIKTGNDAPPDRDAAVVDYVNAQRERYATARAVVEQTWNEAWALYIGTPQAIEDTRAMILQSVGDVDVDWRHRINVGKAYAEVEVIHGYLMAATFPNREFFSILPESPMEMKTAEVIKKFILDKMYDAQFRSHYATFLRQGLITGTSVMALPWRYETVKWKKRIKVEVPHIDPEGIDLSEGVEWEVKEVDKVVANAPEFETLDMFDCYYDVTERDPNKSNFVRRIIKTKAEVIQCMNDGFYKPLEYAKIVDTQPYGVMDNSRKERYAGVNEVDKRPDLSEHVEIWEFWGDIHLQDRSYRDVVATVMGDHLLRFESNPYWCGKPFVVMTYTPLMSTYGMGAMQPNLGLLHELNIVTNARLDNLELSINNMWTLKADGLLQPDQVFTEPGKVFQVDEHDDLQPLPPPPQSYVVTYQEAAVLEQFINQNFGTGPLIGGGQARGGERVTAEEINAVREAGGNRLSNVHKHIEETALIVILQKVMRLMQQFVTRPEIVRVVGEESDLGEYYEIGPEEINQDYTLKPIGSDFLTDLKRRVRAILEFLEAVVQIPPMAAMLNYKLILLDLVRLFGFDSPDRYIKADEQQPPALPPEGAPPEEGMPPPPDQVNGVADDLYNMGGKHLQQAVMNDMSAGGMPQVLQQYFGQQTPPEMQL